MLKKNTLKIAMLLSGGVDSSVALALLKKQNYDITAYYLKIWMEEDTAHLGDCPFEIDLEYARATCNQLDVPLKIIPLQSEYYDRVISYAIHELKRAATPNPDIFCNSRVKFGAFAEIIDKHTQSEPLIATGHYAQVEKKDGLYQLKQSPDPIKDQTYFLNYLTQTQLSRCIFPIGHLKKSKVRDLAHEFNLPTKDRKDSQGICFLGKIKYKDFVDFHLGENEGPMIEIETNKQWGNHRGLWFHTIGQRQGIHLHAGPWYAVKKDLQSNILYISNHRPSVTTNKFNVHSIHWIGHPLPPEVENISIKIRHGADFLACTLHHQNEVGTIVLSQGQSDAIASGQFAVFYQNNYCRGAGIIV